MRKKTAIPPSWEKEQKEHFFYHKLTSASKLILTHAHAQNTHAKHV
jgi:hypothetical protein